MEILYEDNHLFVVNKPAGLLTQPTENESDSLEAQGKAWIKGKTQKPGNVYLHAVHRLDRPVSGIVVFAKTSKALSRLNASIRNQKTKKIYLAWVEGIPNPLAGTLEHRLIHDNFCAKVDPKGKPAKLSYRVIKQEKDRSLVEIELLTGRYHQIRAQFAAMGCPIVGDAKYGSRLDFEKGRIALHHSKLMIEHPTSKEMLFIEAPQYFS